VNKIYEAPRTLLAAIPGLTLVEMPHTRQNSLCCGGGGGGMWLDGFQWNKGHARVSEWRVGEAARTGASVLVVACPYETPRFEDAVKTTGRVEQLAVKDIIELLVEAI
jgi:Fe-S oxidoreductase